MLENNKDEMIKEMPDMTTPGTKKVIIVYEGVEYEVTITVSAIENRAEEALGKIESFLADMNTKDIKKSSLKITLNGDASFLQNNAEFNQELLSIVTEASQLDLNNFDVYQSTNGTWVCYKAFETAEEMFACEQEICKMFAFTDLHIVFLLNWKNAPDLQTELIPEQKNLASQIVIDMSPFNKVRDYHKRIGCETFEDCKDLLHLVVNDWQTLQPQNNKIIANLLVSSLMLVKDEGLTTGVYINTAVGRQVYTNIIKLILNASGQLKSENITDPTNLKASVDLIKTLSQIDAKATAQQFVNWLVGNILVQDSQVYAELATNYLAEIFSIPTEDTALDNAEGVLKNGIDSLKQNFDLKTIHDTIVALNEALQDAEGNEFFLAQLNNLVSGLKGDYQHMASNIASAFKNFARIETRVFHETSNKSELQDNPGAGVRREFEREENGKYYYYDATSVADEERLVNKYFDALTDIIRSIEDAIIQANANQQTNASQQIDVREFANSIIENLRKMDSVIQEMKPHEAEEGPNKWWNVAVTDLGFTFIRTAVEQYKQMYNEQMFDALFEAMGHIYPADFALDTMVVKDDGMEPTIKKGQRVFTKYITHPNDGDINVNDIIVNEYGTCARVIAVFTEGGKIYYVTHADNKPNTDGNTYPEGYQWDINRLNQQNLSVSWVYSNCQNVVLRDNSSEVCVVDLSIFLPLQLPEHLITMLTNCSKIIYDAFNVTEEQIDYVQLIEDLCKQFKLKAKDYVEKYNNGSLHLIRDIAEKTIISYEDNYENYAGEDRTMFDACLEMCDWLDDVILKKEPFNVTTCLDKIHNIANEMSTYFGTHEEEANERLKMLLPLLTIMTDTSQDWQTNLKAYIDVNKQMISGLIAQLFCRTIPDLPENGMQEFSNLINTHLGVYIEGNFNVKALINDFTTFINTYANESGKTIYKSGLVLAIILSNINNPDVNYSELFEGIELPNEIENIGFDVLIRQTLRDKDVYKNLIVIENVEIQFVEDANGSIKEIMTLTIKSNYDILISSMDATTTLTFELEF